MRQSLLQVFPNLDVFIQHHGEVLAVGVPLRGPVLEYRKPEPDWINFLTHRYSLLLTVADSHEHVTRRLDDAVAAALGARGETLEHRPLFNKDGRHLKLIDIRAVVVL